MTPVNEPSVRLTRDEVLRLQRLAGNQAVLRLLRRLRQAEEMARIQDGRSYVTEERRGEQG